MKRNRILNSKIILPLLVFIVLLIVWECIVDIFAIPLYVLPSPSKIALSLVTDFNVLLGHSIVTLLETLIGLAISIVIAIVLAVLMDYFPLFKSAIYPILVVSQTVPYIVLAPIFLIYFGFGMLPKIITIVLMCFFPIVVSFSDAMAGIDKNQINLVKSMGANPFKVYTIVKLPACGSSFFSGLKVSATYSITGAVVGEWLSSQEGLGYYMLRVKNGFMLDKVFACVVVIVILSLLMNGLVKLLQFIFMPHLRKKMIINRKTLK